jgi:hypothetical protein
VLLYKTAGFDPKRYKKWVLHKLHCDFLYTIHGLELRGGCENGMRWMRKEEKREVIGFDVKYFA